MSTLFEISSIIDKLEKLFWTRDSSLEKLFYTSIKPGREHGSLRNIHKRFEEKNVHVYDAMNGQDALVIEAFIRGAALNDKKLSYIAYKVKGDNFRSTFITFFKPEDANKVKTILNEVITANVLES
jgi:hypothetical protein